MRLVRNNWTLTDSGTGSAGIQINHTQSILIKILGNLQARVQVPFQSLCPKSISKIPKSQLQKGKEEFGLWDVTKISWAATSPYNKWEYMV